MKLRIATATLFCLTGCATLYGNDTPTQVMVDAQLKKTKKIVAFPSSLSLQKLEDGLVASDCGNVHLINVTITPYGIGNFCQCVDGLDELPLIDHEAVGDSDTYWFNVGSALGADGNWTALASRNGQPTLAAREFGEGRVVVSGDNDGFSYGLGYSPVGMAAEDNALLYANLATWLCDPGCRLPPGLEKNGKSPPGLQNASGLHGECPPGWEHGEKQGWDD